MDRLSIMNDAECWKLIDELGWGTKTTDFMAIARRLYGVFDPNRKELWDFVKKRWYELENRVECWEEENRHLEIGSGDGMSDLFYHVIGLGKEEFEKCMKSPRRLEVRHNTGGYKECFAYCFQEPEKNPPVDKAAVIEDTILLLEEQIEDLQKSIGNMSVNLKELRQLVAENKKTP